MTFWSILAYTLFATDYEWELCIVCSFVASYLSLWADLAFKKIAEVYEKLY